MSRRSVAAKVKRRARLGDDVDALHLELGPFVDGEGDLLDVVALGLAGGRVDGRAAQRAAEGDARFEVAVLLILALQRARALGELDVVERAGAEDGELVAQLARGDGAVADELDVDLALHGHAHRQADAMRLAIGVAREVELGDDARRGEAFVAQHLLGGARIVAHLRDLEAQPVVEDVVELRARQVLVAVFVIVDRHDGVELVGRAEVDDDDEIDPLRARLPTASRPSRCAARRGRVASK